jgi:hypothetical protein
MSRATITGATMDFTGYVPQCEQRDELRTRPERPDEPFPAYDVPFPDDDSQWDVFIPDDDEIDPLPEPGDFWIEPKE